METQDILTAPRPGRPKRAEVTHTERRRRKGGTIDKLEIPRSAKEAFPDMEFRWARDDEGRIQQLTINDDWDKVPDIAPIHGGKGSDRSAIKMHLLMKPKAFMEEDRAQKRQERKERRDTQLARPEAAKAVEMGAEMYSVPGNKI